MNKLMIPPTLIAYNIIAMISFYVFLPSFQLIPLPYSLMGLGIIYAGIVVMGKSRELLKKYNTTFAIAEPSFFVREGIFSKTRNPMYLGMFIFLIGVGFCFGNLLSMVTPILFLALVNSVVIPREEKLMASVFGEKYLEYKQSVRRWI